MSSQEYFNERFERLSQKQFRQGDKTLPVLQRLFSNANTDIRKQIDAFYARYGVVQSAPVITTLADGSQVARSTAPKLVVTVQEAQKYERLAKLEKQINTTLVQLSKDENAYMHTVLGDIAKGTYYDTLYITQYGYGIGQSFTLLDPKIIKSLIESPVMGQDFSTRIWENRRKLANVVNQELQNGIIQGVSNKEVTKRVSERMNSGYKVAERLIQTEMTNAYGQANLMGYKESGLVEKYVYQATLDTRTSKVCIDLDNDVFFVKDAVVGLNFAPMHTRCRGTTSAFFDARLGERRARDGKNTYTVPAEMNAKDWQAIYVDKTMTRAEWNKGKRTK